MFILKRFFTYKESEYIKKCRMMFEAQGDSSNISEAQIDIIIEREKKEYYNNIGQVVKSIIEVCLWVAMFFVAFVTYQTQKDLWSISNIIQLQNTELNKILIQNSKDQLYLAKTQTTFQVLNTLNKSIWQKEYDKIKDGLKHGGNIDKKQLQNYINNFENIYMSCHRWLVPLDDIRYNFEYLLGDICSNKIVLWVTKNWYWWLKKLCWLFFPDSNLSKVANMSTNNCIN